MLSNRCLKIPALAVLLVVLSCPAQALLITSMNDVWMLELACMHSHVNFYSASGSLLARAKNGKLSGANGAMEAEIRNCQRIQDRGGRFLARRDESGRYYLANGSLLGRVANSERFYAANGAFVLRLSTGAIYNPSGSLLARFRVE